MTFQESASTRRPVEVAVTLLVTALGLTLWPTSVPRITLALIAVGSSFGLIGCAFPHRYLLTVDREGIRWSRRNGKSCVSFGWADIRVVRYDSGEKDYFLGTRGTMLEAIPPFFLRTGAQRAAFFAAVQRLSPQTAIEHSFV